MDLPFAFQWVPGYDFEIEIYCNLKMLMLSITGYIEHCVMKCMLQVKIILT